MVVSLFNLCVEVVLQSASLSKKAALHLPLRISQYILYEACCSKNFVAVEKLVEAWPHPTLSFDFLSFPLCKRRRESSKSCLLAPEYFNVDSNDELAPCITSIAVGVFRNVQQRVYSCNSLQVVDLSGIRTSSIDDGELDLLYKNGHSASTLVMQYIRSAAEGAVWVRDYPKP